MEAVNLAGNQRTFLLEGHFVDKGCRTDAVLRSNNELGASHDAREKQKNNGDGTFHIAKTNYLSKAASAKSSSHSQSAATKPCPCGRRTAHT
jgi:hypothetical protein